MNNSTFVAFVVGLFAGGCLGIMVAGFMAVIHQTEERAQLEREKMMKGEHYDREDY